MNNMPENRDQVFYAQLFNFECSSVEQSTSPHVVRARKVRRWFPQKPAAIAFDLSTVDKSNAQP
jgi:hypothetical protein